jgi:hypothetical protein
MADDDVQLTDLEVISRFSLAVRSATASRAELVAALQSDLEWLCAGRTAPRKAPAAKAPAKRAPAKKAAR